MIGDWFEDYWVQVASTLTAALVLSLVSKTARAKLWVHVWRAVRALATIRVVTTKTLDELRRAGTQSQLELAALRRHYQALSDKQDELVAELRDGSPEVREIARRLGEAQGVVVGRAQAMAEVEAQRAAPRAQPVWRVEVLREGERYVLRNSQHDSVVRDVSLATREEEFVFHGPNQWPGDHSGKDEFLFAGVRLNMGRRHGVRFTIAYRDDLGDPQVGQARLDREPLRGGVIL